jgi:hypothetical protein
VLLTVVYSSVGLYVQVDALGLFAPPQIAMCTAPPVLMNSYTSNAFLLILRTCSTFVVCCESLCVVLAV